MPPKKSAPATLPTKQACDGRPKPPKNSYMLFCDWVKEANVDINGVPGHSLSSISATRQHEYTKGCWDGTRPIVQTIYIGKSVINNQSELQAHFKAKYAPLKEAYEQLMREHQAHCPLCGPADAKPKRKAPPEPAAAATMVPKKAKANTAVPWIFCAKCATAFGPAGSSFCSQCGQKRGTL